MYCVKIKDISGREIIVEVSYEVYQAFEDERKELERERYEFRKHLDKRSLEDYVIGNDPIAAPETLEDLFSREETLRTIRVVLHSCTPIQQERFYLHFFGGYSYGEIARIHNCKKQVVHESIQAILKKIKKFF